MINENLPFIAVLFVNGCPVGIINRFGFIVSIPETEDIYYPSKNGIISLPYHLKSSNRESVRFYKVFYRFRYNHPFVDDIVKSCKRVELHFESLPVEIIEQRQKTLTIEYQLKKLEKLQMLPLFDFIVSSEEVNAEKPSGKLFRTCAVKAGVSPEECLFIGDNLKKDVLGPRAVGMKSLWYCPDSDKAAANGQIERICRYDQLMKMLENLNETE